jgi:hypothetical protein
VGNPYIYITEEFLALLLFFNIFHLPPNEKTAANQSVAILLGTYFS